MSNRAMAFSLALCMLLAGCGNSNVSEEETTEVNSDTDGVRQITLKQSTTVPILLDDTVAATSDDVNNILENLGEYDSTLIKKSAGILDGESKLTRYQVAAIASDMIEQQSATPDITWYQITYTDNSEIPENYVQDICVVDKAGIMEYDGEFNGYSNVSKDELQSIIEKTLEFISTAPKNQNTTSTSNTDNKGVGVGVGEEVSREVYKDNLNGASVALIKEPKTTGELNLNLENISEVGLDSLTDTLLTADNTLNKESENVDIEYINMDEFFVDYELIKDEGVDYVTTTSPYKFIEEIDIAGNLVLKGDILKKKMYGIFLDVNTAVLVKDNNIICKGTYITDAVEDSNGIVLFRDYAGDIDYDYLGMVCIKEYLEGRAEAKEFHKALLLIPKEVI